MADISQLESALVKADAAGDAEGARILASEIRRMRTVQEPTTQTPDQGPSSGMADIAANPITRFAVAAGSPVMGAGELLPGGLGKWFAEKNAGMKQLVAEGNRGMSDNMQTAGTVADIGGAIASPFLPMLGKGMGVAKTFPQMAKQGAMLGLIGGATTPTGSADLQDKIAPTLVGGGVGGIAAPVVGKVASGISNIVAPLVSQRAVDLGSGRLANTAAGTLAPNVASRLQQALPDETAAQAAAPSGSSEFAALQKLLRGHKGTEFDNVGLSQEAKRLADLRRITPNLQNAEGTRQGLAQPFYSKADKAVVTLDNEMMGLFDRMPKGTLERAADIARMDGRKFQIGQYQPAQQVPTGVLDSASNPITTTIPAQYPKITGESLHYIKRALSDIANAKDPSLGIAVDTQKAARGVLEDYLPAFEKRVPDYETARKTFAANSPPVNQSKILGKMQSVLNSGTGVERVSPFMAALGSGEEALLKRSTGFPRYQQGDLPKVLSPQQMKIVNDIKGQLEREISLSMRERGGQKGAMKALGAEGTKGETLPGLIDYRVTILNSILRRLEGYGGTKIEENTAKLMLPGNVNKLGQLMQEQAANPQGWLGKTTPYFGNIAPGLFGQQE